MKRFISIILVMVMMFVCAAPVFAIQSEPEQTAVSAAEEENGDSFIITTEDGKVIVIDGGYKFETDYFIQYLRAVTGQLVPKIDVWFLTHPHTDHVQVFNEVAENRTNQIALCYIKYAIQ